MTRAIRGRTMPNEAPPLRVLPRPGAPFPIIFRERLRVSKATLAALGAGAALTRAARSLLQRAITGAPDCDAVSRSRLYRPYDYHEATSQRAAIALLA